MYSTCIFCHAGLGSNEVIERFPIGRRLAFDATKGRLWVVCRRCERWNLTPLEERWEAIEESERAFRATRLRVSTDNIGLARLRDGTELVRVGRPLRPELAAWRYGDQFGRRRRRTLVGTGVGVVVLGGFMVGGVALGYPMLVIGGILQLGARVLTRASPAPHAATIIEVSDARLRLTGTALHQARLAWDAHRESWALELPTAHLGVTTFEVELGLTTLEGSEAVRAAALMMPAINRFGGSPAKAREAVALLEHHGDPDALFRAIASEWDGTATGYRDLPSGAIEFVAGSPRGYLTRLASAQRLALEMAAHEDMERLALEGELRELETAWRNAEEIAAIADDLLVPNDVRAAVTDRLNETQSG